jgi:hypothetical protein
MMTDKCSACGSTDNDGWLLETVVDHETNLVTSREVACTACEARKAATPAPAPAPVRRRPPVPVPDTMPVYESESVEVLAVKC